MPKCAKIAVTILSLCWTLAVLSAAQTDHTAPDQPIRRALSKHGPGKQKRQGVRVPFNPGLRDKDGKVIQAVPDVSKFEGEEEGPRLSEKALADKAKAEAGEFNMLTKP